MIKKAIIKKEAYIRPIGLLGSLRKQPTFGDATISPPNDVWERSAEIPYWWRVTTQIWVVLRIG